MQGRCLADRLGDFLTLTATERTALDALEQRPRTIRRGAILVRENDRSTELFALRQGLMMSYVLLDDGSRQILQFLLPGDLFGASALAYAAAPQTLVALSESVVFAFDRTQLAALALQHPRLWLAITALDEAERAALTDRLAGLGRTSAKARIAAVLLDIRDRRRRCGEDAGDTFTLGLTQEEIGDATGLTAVHVNRMLRQLEDQGLIARTGGRVTLRDEATLRRAANYIDRLAKVDLSLLPPAAA